METQADKISTSLAEKYEHESLIADYIKTNWQSFAESEMEAFKRRRLQRRARATAAAMVSCRRAG